MTLKSHTSPPTDPELIRRALAGDRFAADQLTQRHRRAVLAVAWRALGNADDAQDVTQETLVYAVQRLGDLRDPGRFPAWLHGIALSLSADYRRRRGTRKLGEPLTLLNEASEEIDFIERLSLRESLEGLSEAHRSTVLLHYMGGWSLEEVARILEIPVNTVRSRLMAAKRLLRRDLPPLVTSNLTPKRKPMSAESTELPLTHASLLQSAFPGARIVSILNEPEPWMPFGPRVELELPDGSGKTVDFRDDIDADRVELLRTLERLKIPGPRILHGPMKTGNNSLTLCEVPRGENLSIWALGGTPHRIGLATERAFEGIDRLQNATEDLLNDPAGAKLPRRTLLNEVAILTTDDLWNADPWLAEAGASRAEWLRDPWFSAALRKVTSAVADIADPLVYTNSLFFFPQGYRIQAGDRAVDEPLGWPGDPQGQQNPLVEFTYLFGHIGDPLVGLAMVWVQDCYPFVHTGFVEQFLWRRGVTRRQFAPRLALKALQMVARDLPLTRPAEGSGYWDALRGWAEQGLGWM